MIDLLNVSTFSKLRILTSLDLSKNRISIMEPGAFRGLVNLALLYLKSNKIAFLVANLFIDLKLLKELDLSENYLSVIEPGCLNGLESLTELSLDDNPIYTLKNHSFSSLKSMKDITFNSLGLASIESFAFTGMRQLKQLNIQMNKNISYLDRRSFHGLDYLEILYLDLNEIRSIHPDSFLGLKTLAYLSLFKNKLSEIDTECFRDMINLEDVDLSYNKIRILKKGNFKYLRNLKYLTILDNDLESIEGDLFESAAHGLLELNLQSNKLQILRNYYFRFRKLTKLLLKSNQISVIESETFGQLYHLAFLDLSDNCLLYIDSTIFRKRIPAAFLFNHFKEPELKIDLSKNVIYTIKNGTFVHLSQSLVELRLRSNQIIDVQTEAFIENSLLKTISFESNFFHADSTLNLRFLVNLNLADNKLKRIFLGANIFSNFSSVETLDISRNQIESLNSGSFVGLRKCRSINMTFNRIRYLSGSLRILGQLNTVLLSNNLLEFIEFKDFSNLNFLIHLDLSNNPNLFVVANDAKFINLKLEILYFRNTSRNLTVSTRLSSLRSLTELDLSHNNLSHLNLNYLSPYLNRIQLENVELLDFRAFENKNELLLLDLSNNLGLNFTRLDSYLKSSILSKLFMSNMGIRCIRNTINFTHYPKLEDLNLSCNEISRIRSSQFAQNRNLLTLNLSFNNISILEEGSLSSIQSLNTLDLRSNKLKNFTESLPAVKNLDLSCNKMTYVSIVIDKISKVNLQENLLQENEIQFIVQVSPESSSVTVDLSFNKIKTINRDLSFMTKELGFLYLRGNEIESIANYSFLKLNNLLVLDLSQNFLSEMLEIHSFKGLYYLENLNLSYNRIEVIRKELFQDFSYLYTIDLSKNSLKFIEDFAFMNLKNVILFFLNSNPDLKLLQSKNVLYGLDSIHNFFLSPELIEEKTSLVNMKDALRPKILKQEGELVFYESLNLQYDGLNQTKTYTKMDCNHILYFIKFNVHLNLKHDSDVFKFFIDCKLF
jgi:Leucine-rich repeat (LRR) protein